MADLSSLNFSWLAKISTGRRPRLFGLLPPLSTVAALLATAFVISGAWWLWTGASLAAAVFLPVYAKTFFAVCGLTLLNFVFNREIHTFMYSTREVREKFIFDKENPTDLRRLVNHIRCELNIYFRKKYGDKHVDIPMPRLLTFTDPHFELISVDGMNAWNSALLFSSGVFNSHETGLDQRDLAALIATKMVKSYLNRGRSHLFVRMGVDLLSTLENFHQANFFTKLLGVFTWPLEFLFLYERQMHRSYEYEADSIVAEHFHRGADLLNALDTKVCSSLFNRPTTKQLNDEKIKKLRAPYTGFLAWLIQPIKRWADLNLVLPEDHQESPALWDYICGFVREFGFHFNEIRSLHARTTRRKENLRCHVPEHLAEDSAAMKKLYQDDKAKNQALYDQMNPADRYDIIGPQGNGKGVLVKKKHKDEHGNVIKKEFYVKPDEKTKNSQATHQHGSSSCSHHFMGKPHKHYIVQEVYVNNKENQQPNVAGAHDQSTLGDKRQNKPKAA